MAQGNPFGRAGGRWMTNQKLRALFAAGLTYDEVAEANERSEGWKPSRAAVKRKYEAMGMPPRRASSKDLIPWRIRPEHNSSVYRHMLQAESRARQHKELSDTDKKLIARLHEQLFGRGKLMVVGYHEDVGFFLAPREDQDDDIIRAPRSDHFSPEATAEIRPARTQTTVGADGEPAQKQRSGKGPRGARA